MSWRLKPTVKYASKGVTTVFMKNGKHEVINLAGFDLTIRRPATRTHPARDVFFRGATQDDYEYLMKKHNGDWSHMIEWVDEPASPDIPHNFDEEE